MRELGIYLDFTRSAVVVGEVVLTSSDLRRACALHARVGPLTASDNLLLGAWAWPADRARRLQNESVFAAFSTTLEVDGIKFSLMLFKDGDGGGLQMSVPSCSPHRSVRFYGELLGSFAQPICGIARDRKSVV